MKTIVNCEECKNPFKISYGSHASICPDCLITKKNNLLKLSSDLKEGIKDTSTRFEFEFNERGQKLSAVKSQGEAFASKGGVDLMITEFIENSFDAIKKKHILHVLPQAIKLLNSTSTFEKIIYEKYTIPPFEFVSKYPNLTPDELNNLQKLEQKILDLIKNQKPTKEFIIIELDDNNEQVKIIDSGTGIEHPIHICTKPLMSLKTGENNLQITGKFGRGSQVFREFCGMMEFYSLRNSVISSKEIEHIKNKSLETTAKSILLRFPHNDPAGFLDYIDVDQYSKLSKNTKAGTVVVLSDWWEDNYRQLSSHISKLQRRLQHHFGFAVDDMFNIGLKIVHGNKEFEITKKDYASDPKIQGLFDLKPISLTNPSDESSGQVEFYVYKTTKSYQDDFKKPFLVVNGRPLGDSTISDIPNLSQVKETWESNTITGYVVCNAVIPNQMRTGLSLNWARQPFVNAMSAASIDLKRLNTEWKNELSSAKDVELTNEVVQTVTSYLSKKGIKFNFKNPLQKGLQENLNETGDETDLERISIIPGGNNQGMIDPHGDETVEIGYEPGGGGGGGGHGNGDDVIIVPHGSRKKDGDKIITVKIKRSLVSKGGRKIRKSYSGPDLRFNADEHSGNELSYFEPEPPTIFVQQEHPAWKKLVRKAREQTNAEKFENDKKKYLIERYLWELMINPGLQTKNETSPEERRDLFWTFYHELVDTK